MIFYEFLKEIWLIGKIMQGWKNISLFIGPKEVFISHQLGYSSVFIYAVSVFIYAYVFNFQLLYNCQLLMIYPKNLFSFIIVRK